MPEVQNAGSSDRLTVLLGFLDADPGNLTLLSEAAETALIENKPEIARDLLNRYSAKAALPDREANLAGLAALRGGDFEASSAQFRALSLKHPGDASIRFNLAWSEAMLGDIPAARDLLDQRTVETLPQAAALKLQILHDQGLFDEAEAFARRAITRHPDHPGLLAAVSTLAMDINDPDLARETAMRAGSQPEALVTLGTLVLTEDPKQALSLFSQALAANSAAPRALVGKGLALLASGNAAEAVESLQHGAEVFVEHVGSWIATGWAQVVNGNIEAARKCFEKAVELDRNFAESQGSLAVIAIMTGRVDEGRHLAAIANRLDSKSFSGALANSLLVSAAGRPEVARAIIQRALNTPIAEGGRTLAQIIARNALGH